MFAYDNAYSRFVAWMKIVLPLMALAILSTLFLVSKTRDAGTSLPYSAVELDELARQQRLTRPRYSGLTQDGTAISFLADDARPDPEISGRFVSQRLTAQLNLPTGAEILLIAGSGFVDPGEAMSGLDGGVAIETSTGYMLRTDEVENALDQTRVVARGGVVGVAPMGQISAGQMEITRHAIDTGYVMLFTGGVKLVYDPESQGDAR